VPGIRRRLARAAAGLPGRLRDRHLNRVGAHDHGVRDLDDLADRQFRLAGVAADRRRNVRWERLSEVLGGGHLDVAVLGGFQVSEKGDLANWKIPGAKGSGGIGGAMDIAAGAKTLIVCMEHTTKDGAPKIVKQCTYPLTGLACVDTIVTDVAVIDVNPEGLVLREVAPGWTAEEVQNVTGAPLIAKERIPDMTLG